MHAGVHRGAHGDVHKYCICAGSLESAYSSSLATHRFSSEVVGKNQGFMLISNLQSESRLVCRVLHNEGSRMVREEVLFQGALAVFVYYY